MTATHAVHVHPSNAEQLRAWDGDEGAYWAANADYFKRAMAASTTRSSPPRRSAAPTECSTSAAAPA
jgi:hypothetical protein